jgi:hypothetical protein
MGALDTLRMGEDFASPEVGGGWWNLWRLII